METLVDKLEGYEQKKEGGGNTDAREVGCAPITAGYLVPTKEKNLKVHHIQLK